MNQNEFEYPICYQAVSFLMLPVDEQLHRLNTEVKNIAGRRLNPIYVFAAFLAYSLIGDQFYEYYYQTDDNRNIPEDIMEKIGTFDVTRDRGDLYTIDAFRNAQEWQELRELAKELLQDAKIAPCPVPCPIPFDDWIDFSRCYLEPLFTDTSIGFSDRRKEAILRIEKF